MAKSLVLAEKPSVGRELGRVLGCRSGGEGYLEGDRYVVTWALGHLVTLADPEVYEKSWEKWEMDYLPMLPQKMKLVVIPQTAKQFRVVQRLMKREDIAQLIIATDAGREGELVARWIMEKAGWHKPAKRLWISSQTDRAIREGFARLRPASEYDSLYASARARSVADWLVGLNVTRALTCKYNAQLSAGRVQTPTLALIVAREKEIRQFVPKAHYGVQIALEGFHAIWRDEKGQSRTFQREKAEDILRLVEGGEAVVTQVTKQWKQTPPPALYDLTELQRDANKRFAYSAKETLNIMQSLYERHKVLTYPRTDSRYLPADVVPALPGALQAVMVGDYKPIAQSILRNRPLQTKYMVNDAKVTDHHAIIPTEQAPELWQMTGPERNIYDLVVRRFLAALLPPFEYEEVKLTLTCRKQTFTAKGRIIRQQGWKAASGSVLPEEDEEEAAQSLPPIQQGQRMKLRSCRLVEGKTSPPARYTEATLLTAMEHPTAQVSDRELGRILEETSGLGTPATRADIIEKLFSAFYIERRGKELVPTSKGIQLMDLAPEDLRSAELTARWEDQLAKIAKGQEKEQRFVDQMGKYATRLVQQVKVSDARYVHDNQTRKTCPDCGKYLLLVNGKRGQMLVCPDRACGYRKSVTQTTNARCPNCHKKMELRGEGEKQMFACVCGYREKLSDFKEKKNAAGAGKREVQKYMQAQNRQEPANNPMAQALAQWLEKNGK